MGRDNYPDQGGNHLSLCDPRKGVSYAQGGQSDRRGDRARYRETGSPVAALPVGVLVMGHDASSFQSQPARGLPMDGLVSFGAVIRLPNDPTARQIGHTLNSTGSRRAELPDS